MSFKLFGIKVEISFILGCIIALYIAGDRTGVILPALVSIICHELAHILVLKAFKCRVKKVKLLIGTVGIEYDREIPYPKDVAALFSGPASNFLLSAVFYISGNDLWMGVNLLTGLYNLFPLKGLDGGSICRIILSRFLKERLVRVVLCLLNLVGCIAFLVLFLLYFIKNYCNYSFLLLCIYLILPLILKKIG